MRNATPSCAARSASRAMFSRFKRRSRGSYTARLSRRAGELQVETPRVAPEADHVYNSATNFCCRAAEDRHTAFPKGSRSSSPTSSRRPLLAPTPARARHYASSDRSVGYQRHRNYAATSRAGFRARRRALIEYFPDVLMVIRQIKSRCRAARDVQRRRRASRTFRLASACERPRNRP